MYIIHVKCLCHQQPPDYILQSTFRYPYAFYILVYSYLQRAAASWWLIKFTWKYIRKISSRLTQLRDILNCIIESISNLKPSNFILKHHTNKLCCHGGRPACYKLQEIATRATEVATINSSWAELWGRHSITVWVHSPSAIYTQLSPPATFCLLPLC